MKLADEVVVEEVQDNGEGCTPIWPGVVSRGDNVFVLNAASVKGAVEVFVNLEEEVFGATAYNKV